MCEPSPSPENVTTESQGEYAGASSAQRNVASGSASVYRKVAPVARVSLSGCPSITGAGGAMLSTVQIRWAGVSSSFPAASIAPTRNVCEPCVRWVRWTGDVQGAKGAPSFFEHSKWAFDSFEEKVILAEVDLENAGGPESTAVSGGVRSTVHVKLALSLQFPAASTAATKN